MLTAAHCIPGGTDTLGEVRFFPSTATGLPSPDGMRARAVTLHPGYLPARSISPQSLIVTARDMALLRLERPVDPALAVPLAVRPPTGEEELFVTSYRTRQSGALRQRRCPVLRSSADVAVLGCAVRGGESGSPMLARTPDGPVVSGVVVQRLDANGNDMALGPRVGREFAVLRAAAPP